jgi:hypothetical protein
MEDNKLEQPSNITIVSVSLDTIKNICVNA